MNVPSYEFFRHALVKGVGGWSGCGGGGFAVAVAAGGAGCVCAEFRAVLRRGGRCPWCAGRRRGLVGHGPDSAARRVPQLQFSDLVETCLLLRRQVQFSDKVLTCPLLRRQVQFLDTVEICPLLRRQAQFLGQCR